MTNVPRVLKIDHKEALTPERHLINHDFNANDHSRYTKYPQAADHHYFQNLGQTFNNKVVSQVRKNVEYSRPPIQEDTESMMVKEY